MTMVDVSTELLQQAEGRIRGEVTMTSLDIHIGRGIYFMGVVSFICMNT